MIRILKYGQVPNGEIFARVTPSVNVEEIVSGILADVKKNGDQAVLAYTRKLDGAELRQLQVTEEEIQEALKAVEPEFLAILEQAAENIRAFHSKQVRSSFVIADRPGIVLGQKITPIEKVGVYVPGGTAAYPVHGADGHHPGENRRMSPGGDGFPAGKGRQAEPRHCGGGPDCRGGRHLQDGRGPGHRRTGLRHGERAQGG